MNEIINSILEAEKKADEVIKSATEKSKSDILASDDKAEKIKEDAVAELKVFRKNALSKAEETALSEYQEIIRKGEKDAELLKQKSGVKKDSAVLFVEGRIFD